MHLLSNIHWVLICTVALGALSGTVSALTYWKNQSLMSDALSHAVLPGVVISYMLSGVKHTTFMFIGACISALLASFFITAITKQSKIKADTAMGIVLATFFSLGLVLLTIVNNMPNGQQSGINSFIYGQAATLLKEDMLLTIILAVVIIAFILMTLNKWRLFLFDPQYAKLQGVNIARYERLYLFIVVLTIVIGIKAVGIILMAALLIIPAAASKYWSKTLVHTMLLSAIIGGFSAAIGTWISTQGNQIPTGPMIVIVASSCFALSLIGAKGMEWFNLYMLRKVGR